MKILAHQRLAANVTPSEVHIRENLYKVSHGRLPKANDRGNGFFFSLEKYPDFSQRNEGITYFVSDHTARTYKDAVKQAKDWAASLGYRVIYLLP